MDVRHAIVELARALDRELDAIEPLALFAALCATWNAKLNLTGARDPRALAEVLFADALVLRELVPDGVSLIDVGAGAGAPTVPLLLLRPDLRATLLEPRKNRVAFMRTAIGSFEDLPGRAVVIPARLEDATLDEHDLALSRATFSPPIWLAHGLALAPQVVVLSGAEGLPAHDDAELVATRGYRLPFGGTPREAGLYRRRS